MASPIKLSDPTSPIVKRKTGHQVYKEICSAFQKNPSSTINSAMADNNFVLKLDSLMDGEIDSLKELFERHHFQMVALYKEIPELGDLFDPKTVSLKPKFFKSGHTSMSSKSFSRFSSSMRQSKSPKSDKKKPIKPSKASENIPRFCKILVPQLSQAENLEIVKFFGIKMTKQALLSLSAGIKENHSIKELYIVYCELMSQDFELIYESISENNHINLLDVSHNLLDDSAGGMLGRIIGVHGRKRDEILWVYSIRGDQPDEDPELKGICDLNVSFNQLGSRALTDMSGSLKHDTWLRNLNLRGNQIGDEGIENLWQTLSQNNSIFAVDLRENPFFNPQLSREIVNKLATNIYNYKEKNMMVTGENYEFSPSNTYENHAHHEGHDHPDMNSQEQTFQEWNGHQRAPNGNIQGSDSGLVSNPVENEEIDKLIKKYEGKSPEESKRNSHDKRLEGVSFGFRNEKIKENLRKNTKDLKVKQTRSEGKIASADERRNLFSNGDCANCRELEKKLLQSESKGVNLLLENYKLKKKLNAVLQAQNSWSAISPQPGEIDNTSNIPHHESLSQEFFKKNTVNLGEQPVPDSEEVFNRIENLMAELTRMMDNLENVNATNNFTGQFTNSTHLTNNNTYQLINSANNINFNSTYTNILNSNNNSRLNALHNPNLQQTISMHQGQNRDGSKSFSKSKLKNNPNLQNDSEQIETTPPEIQESKAISHFSLSFQNDNSHINHSHY